MYSIYASSVSFRSSMREQRFKACGCACGDRNEVENATRCSNIECGNAWEVRGRASRGGKKKTYGDLEYSRSTGWPTQGWRRRRVACRPGCHRRRSWQGTRPSLPSFHALFRSPRATRTSLHCSPSVCRAVSRVCTVRTECSSPLRAWWTLAEVMAYARARWMTHLDDDDDDDDNSGNDDESAIPFILLENEGGLAREEAPDVDLRICQFLGGRERTQRRTHSVARTQRDEDWGLLSTHWRSLVPPPRRALPLPPSRLIAILLGTSYLEDYYEVAFAATAIPENVLWWYPKKEIL